MTSFLLLLLDTIVVNTDEYCGSAVVDRELHKLDSITRTPLLSHCVETVAGLRTIRAFRSVLLRV